MRTIRSVLIPAIVAVTVGACGPATSPNGYWLPTDGGAGVVVYEHDGGQLWFGDDLNFPRISFGLIAPCQDYERAPDGSVSGNDSEATVALVKNHLLPKGGDEFELQFEFPSALNVDQKYRLLPTNPPSMSGPVTARFSGTMVLESPQTATVSYRVEYHDSAALLSTDEASFTVSRLAACR